LKTNKPDEWIGNSASIDWNYHLAGTRFAPDKEIGGFDPKPKADNDFLNNMKNYIKSLIGWSIVEEDKQYLEGTINFFNYDLKKFGSITISKGATVTVCICSGTQCTC
jgi:hypothetical protein